MTLLNGRMNDDLKRVWKEAVVTVRHCPVICVVRLRKTTELFGRCNRCPG